MTKKRKERPDETECIICYEESSPRGPPIRSGCACRNRNEISHVSCRLKNAKAAGGENWYSCSTCKQLFSGEMRLVLAKEWCTQTEDLHETDEQRIDALHNLACAFDSEGLHVEAEAVQRDVVAVYTRKSGEDDASVLDLTSFLANILTHLGKLKESEQMIRKVLQAQKRIQVDHQDIIWTESALGIVLSNQGKYVEAENIQRKLLEESQAFSDNDGSSPHGYNLGIVLNNQHKFAEAETLLRRVLEARKLELGLDHPDTLWTGAALSMVLDGLGKHEEAKEVARNILARSELSLGNEHHFTKHFASGLADILVAKGVSLS